MDFVKVGTTEDFADSERLLIEVEDRSVVVFQIDGEFFAYENRCPHMAGPVGKGRLNRKVTAQEQPDDSLEEVFDDSEVHLACPWHGYEFNVKTGVCTGDDRIHLSRYEVKEDNGNVSIRAVGSRRTDVSPVPAPFET